MSHGRFWLLTGLFVFAEILIFALLAPIGASGATALDHKQTLASAVMAATSISTLLAAVLAGYFAKKAVEEAGRQADLAREARIAEQRPWIKVDLEITGPYEWPRIGGPAMEVGLNIENIGKTPALNVHTYLEFLPNFNDASEQLKALAESQAKPTYTIVDCYYRLIDTFAHGD